MTTGQILHRGETFQINFDFINHTLSLYTSTKKKKTIPLRQCSVADFYHDCMRELTALGIAVSIWPVPVEVQDGIPFDKDTKHESYDKKYVEQWWHILVKSTIVFEQFRSSFRGKSSPVHFFWGSGDLVTTRFSGRMAKPPHMQGVMGEIMRFAENEENFSLGFWPGDERLAYPAFYSYIYPEPSGMKTVLLDNGASFNEQLNECILPYDSVRKAKNPESQVLHFLESTYTKSATLAGWDMQSLQQTTVPNFLHS